MSTIGDTVKSADWKNEKHVPVIDLPEGGISATEAKCVTVQVGKEIAHPNTTAHFIQWIKLYFQPASGPVVELGGANFSAHGASGDGADSVAIHTEPKTCFAVKLDKPGKLIACSYCNIHGLWESSVEV